MRLAKHSDRDNAFQPLPFIHEKWCGPPISSTTFPIGPRRVQKSECDNYRKTEEIPGTSTACDRVYDTLIDSHFHEEPVEQSEGLSQGSMGMGVEEGMSKHIETIFQTHSLFNCACRRCRDHRCRLAHLPLLSDPIIGYKMRRLI